MPKRDGEDREKSSSPDVRKVRRRHVSDEARNSSKELGEAEKRAEKKARKSSKKLGEAKKFVWVKKIERDVSDGVSIEEFSRKAQKKKHNERMAEIEKVKKRREQRALEKAQHEEVMARLARERARAEADDFEKIEEESHFAQSKLRSRNRVREGRTKPIDVLITYLEDSVEFVLEPYEVFEGLNVSKMESLREDIKMTLHLDREHVEYWQALLVVCDWELAEAVERGIHSSTEEEEKKILEGKSHQELIALQSQYESDMRSGTAKVVEFWEAFLKHLGIYIAKAYLKEFHADKMLRKHRQRIEQPLEVTDTPEDIDADKLKPGESEPDKKENVQEIEDISHEIDEEAGSLSPQLVHGDENEEAIDPEEDIKMLQQKSSTVIKEQRRLQQAMASKPSDDYEKIASQDMGPIEKGDAVFGSGAEVNLDSQVYWWHDKYRPRKPKYFNRVHTGYDWNKYNKTHYDHDNPPPTIVQGYKFNIFYPDLVDKIKAPVYFIEEDGDSAETCIIRFHAGPPYEDIAFKIVQKEWEYSQKKGFKCTFERGILHVYFNFKSYPYRR